ncbi:MAG: hypothetical protein QE274_01000 [Verrucomicrobiaceae bacterium]|nr:hypothetical protein [Verrucomicrobiaceae bacterium]
MRPTLTALMLVTATHAADPEIEFAKQPEPTIHGIPKEAQNQTKTGPHDQGTLAKHLGDSVQTITVHYASKDWTNDELNKYLLGLLTDTTTATYTFQIWSQVLTTPEVECTLHFKDQKQGRLLLWQTCGCFQDPQGRWWFLSLFDHYHTHHPLGTRRNPKKP